MKTTGIMITVAAIALCGSVSAQQQSSAGTITGINRLTGRDRSCSVEVAWHKLAVSAVPRLVA